MMNRVFHARLVAAQYAALGLLSFLTFFGFWRKEMILAVSCMLLLVVCIERLIHTTYTLTSDGKLVLYRGRFSRGCEIALVDIHSIELTSSMKIGNWALMHYVLVNYGAQKCEVFIPVNEAEFIRVLKKRIQEVQQEIHV